ncbi:ComF family protein [Frigidibacter sp. MR17.14]|uniref:ComF family protein n=1 Tax=Frigidibacter sp. MR17.14 TaxID=3126509 RepID=UPI003012C7A1
MVADTSLMRAQGKALARRALRLAFPPACAGCGTPVADEGALCGSCWQETVFLTGLVCDLCGAALPGTSDRAEQCDDCRRIPRPWARGRAALGYAGRGRDLAMQLKHGDRLELVPMLAGWMAQAAAPLILPGMVAVPIPLHWRRLLRRRFNQSALLAQGVARRLHLPCCPDALLRSRATPSQEGRSPDERFANLAAAIAPHPRRQSAIAGRPVLLIDDVMTSGATFASATEALGRAGAGPVHVLSLARVAKDG